MAIFTLLYVVINNDYDITNNTNIITVMLSLCRVTNSMFD